MLESDFKRSVSNIVDHEWFFYSIIKFHVGRLVIVSAQIIAQLRVLMGTDQNGICKHCTIYILAPGTDMLEVGKKIGYEQGVKDALKIGYEYGVKDGLDIGYREGFMDGFSQGNLKGIIKGSLITASAIAVVGVTIWGIKQIADRRRDDQNKQEEKPREKLYTVKNYGITDEGVNFYPGDQFRVLEANGKTTIIEFPGEEAHSYEVPLDFLDGLSDYECKFDHREAYES